MILSDLIPEARKQDIINKLIVAFGTDHDLDIGILAAENFLETFIDIVGIEIYNKGVKDAQKYMKERFADIEFEIETLIKDTLD